MASEQVPMELVPPITLNVGTTSYSLFMYLELDGPNAGQFSGLAINNEDPSQSILQDNPTAYRLDDGLNSLVRRVLARELTLLGPPGRALQHSVRLAQSHGLRSPLK